MRNERRKAPLIYVPFGILPFSIDVLCRNPEVVTGRKDSLCVPWGKKCKILHCWISKEKESDWVRSEIHYLVEGGSTATKGICSSSWWISWWSRFVFEMSEDMEICPIITVTSGEHLERLHTEYSSEKTRK